MERERVLCIVLLAASLATPLGARRAAAAPGGPAVKIAPDIDARRRQFVTKTLSADLAVLSAGDRETLKHLVAAAQLVRPLFLRQTWAGNEDLAARLASSSGPGADAAREYFRIMSRPWDELRNHEPFLGEQARPPGAGFYPEDLTRDEFNGWLAKHPTDTKRFLSPTTVIERRSEQRLAAVRYGKVYKDLLVRISAELKSAARTTTSPTLARFLERRASALLSDDYYDSDLAWMDVQGPLEFVLGPYETYEDSLFGYKASFEAFVCVAAPADAALLARYNQELPFLERNLPLPDEDKNLSRGAASPIRVVDLVFSAGDARAGIQTVAFNLPNDERVREAKGAKKVLLKNMMQAKYEAILAPIAARVLPEGEARRLDFDSYFHEILLHEMSHGLGPGRLKLGGRDTEVRLELKDLYSAIEEAKADIVGVYSLYALADKKIVPEAVVAALPWTYTAGLFRSVRFGANDAHGRGVAVQTNYLLAKGALEVTAEGRFRPAPDKFRAGVAELARELLLIEARGDYEGARRLLADYGTPPQPMLARLAELTDIPVDVDPLFAPFETR